MSTPDFSDEELARGIRRPAPDPVTQFLIPVNVSGWSMAAFYLGLIGLGLPILGVVIAVPGVICGIVALVRRRKQTDYGSVTSDIRAILGLVMGGLGTLIWGGLLIFLLLKS